MLFDLLLKNKCTVISYRQYEASCASITPALGFQMFCMCVCDSLKMVIQRRLYGHFLGSAP